jgi:hypothetical protein
VKSGQQEIPVVYTEGQVLLQRGQQSICDAPRSNEEECGTAPVPSLPDRPAPIGSRTGPAISAPTSTRERAQEERERQEVTLRTSRYAIVLLAFFLIDTVWVVAASKSHPLTIEVLSAHMESVPIDNDNNGAPKDCSIPDYSGYCHYTRIALVRNTMLVQDSNGKSFTIACAVELRWSKCALLPVGEKFEARKEKGGIAVFYPDSKGKERKQLYQMVASVPAPQPGADANLEPSAAAPLLNGSPSESPAPAEAVQEIVPEKVKCHFSSTPSGADVTIDGRYVGNTPSEIGVRVGTHGVVISMPGFAEWKRELTVAADSLVNVTASLQKAQP